MPTTEEIGMKQTSLNAFFGWHHNKGRHHSTETRNKISEAKRGQIPWMKGRSHSEETRKKISETLKKLGYTGSNSPNYGKHLLEGTKRKLSNFNRGKHLSEETKKKIGESVKGRHHSEETKQLLRELNTGPNNPQWKKTPWNKGKPNQEETRRKMSISHKKRYIVKDELGHCKQHPRYGIHHTEETKGKISNSRKGRRLGIKLSEEHRRKISEALKGKPGTNSGKRFSLEHRRKISIKAKITRAKRIFPKKDTSIEVKIQQHLKALEIDFIAHHYISIKHAYRCDIYIPAQNMVIECDGDYWHCYPIGKELDHLRTKELMENGYKVLRLWEHEIKEMTAEDLKRKLEEVAQVRIGGPNANY